MFSRFFGKNSLGHSVHSTKSQTVLSIIKPKPIKEQVREWKTMIRKELRQIDRQVWKIEQEEERLKSSIKRDARAERRDNVLIMAKELVRSKRAKSRLYSGKAHMNSVAMQLDSLLAQLKVTETLGQSAELMQSLNQSIKIPEINQFMQKLSSEMIKAGLIQEMFGEALDDIIDDEDLDEATEEEFVKICCDQLDNDLLKLVVSNSTLIKLQTDKTLEEPQVDETGDRDEQAHQINLTNEK